MSDERLRKMGRAATTPADRFRFRVECVRAGRPELAGFEKGDRVEWCPPSCRIEGIHPETYVAGWTTATRLPVSPNEPVTERRVVILAARRGGRGFFAWSPTDLRLLEPAVPDPNGSKRFSKVRAPMLFFGSRPGSI